MGYFPYGGWMIIVWVLMVGLIVWGVIALVRHSSSRHEPDSRRTPLDIARERYAKSEITKEEFERIKKDLM
jgi:putative membrane protein